MDTTNYQETREKCVLAALKLAERQSWSTVSLSDIAQESDISLSELRTYFEDKLDILSALGRMLDRKMLDGVQQNEADGLSVRDRLFDLIMDRFDALNDHRDGIIAILKSFKKEPKQALLHAPHLPRSMAWILDAAGESTHGMKGALKIMGLSAVYLATLKIWMDDESADMSKTMAALDKNLTRAEKAAKLIA